MHYSNLSRLEYLHDKRKLKNNFLDNFMFLSRTINLTLTALPPQTAQWTWYIVNSKDILCTKLDTNQNIPLTRSLCCVDRVQTEVIAEKVIHTIIRCGDYYAPLRIIWKEKIKPLRDWKAFKILFFEKYDSWKRLEYRWYLHTVQYLCVTPLDLKRCWLFSSEILR